MKKLLFILALLCVPLARGQSTFQNPLQGPITSTSAACAVAGDQSCVWQKLAANAAVATVQVSGTFSATLTVEANNGGANFTTLGTITTAGTTSYVVAGFTDFRVRASAYTSGTAFTTINSSPAPSAGGGGTVTSVSGTANQIAVATGTTTPVLSFPSTVIMPGSLGATSYSCGVLNTTGCVITGFGAISGSATITWPAVAGTVTNPLVFSNAITSGGGIIAAFDVQAGATSSFRWAARVSLKSPAADTMELIANTGNFKILQFGGTTNAFPGIQANGASLQAELADSSAQTGWSAATYSTETNCANGASPAVCGTAASGAVAVPTGTNPTLTINTTRVTTNSRIFLSIDESLTISGVTCNTTLSTLIQPVVTARIAGTSFTIQIGAVIAANPACISYMVFN